MKKKYIGRTVRHLLFYAIIIILIIVSIYPFFWLLTTSVKTYSEAIAWPPKAFAKNPSLASYIKTLNLDEFWASVFNSFAFAGGGTFLTLLCSTIAAFGFSRYEFRFKKILFLLVLITLMIPSQITLIPVFLILKRCDWVNTIWGLIVPGIGSAFPIFLIVQYAQGLPDDYFEAARIDGAKELHVYAKIFLPLCKPIISSLVILEFVGRWNDLFWPLIVTNTNNKATLTLLLTTAYRSVYDIYWNDLSAAMVLALIPILLLYVMFQKYFIEGISLSSGVKG